jgi:tellurite resistance protein TerC
LLLSVAAEVAKGYESVEWYIYVAFLAFVVATLFIDLRFFHADEHEPTMKESGTWVAIWVTLAVIFGVAVTILRGGDSGAEYFAGYLIEYSLSTTCSCSS